MFKAPHDCTSKQEIREAIDTIDQQVIALLGKRFQYVKEIVKYKENTVDSIVAKQRYNQVLADRADMAEKHGLSGELIRDLYKQLLDYFIAEELKTINQ